MTELRALALAATPELKTALRDAAELAMHLPWERPGDTIPFQHKQAFRDLATPDAILALLAEIADHERAYELLFKECGELRKDAERWQAMRKLLVGVDFQPDMGGGPAVFFECFAESVSSGEDGADAIADAAISAAKGEGHE
jgi:hypothetical protein